MLFFLLGFSTAVVAASGFYHVGKNLSTRTAQSVWDNLGHECHRVDTFLKIVGDSADRTKSTIRSYARQGRKAVEDFGTGYIEGLVSVLEVVVEHCRKQCSEVGRVSGKVSAGIFCAISQEIGRTATFRWQKNIPNISCGEPYNTSCETTFYLRATNECSYYAKGSAFDKYYRASSGGCCAYNPEQRWP